MCNFILNKWCKSVSVCNYAFITFYFNDDYDKVLRNLAENEFRELFSGDEGEREDGLEHVRVARLCNRKIRH